AAVFADRLAFASGSDFLGATALAGPGGSIGAWLSLWLNRILPPVAQLPVLGVALLLGLVLAVDVLLWRIAKGAWYACRAVLRFILRRSSKAEVPLRSRPRKVPVIQRAQEVQKDAPQETQEDEVPEKEKDEEEDLSIPSKSTAITTRAIPIRYHDRLDAS